MVVNESFTLLVAAARMDEAAVEDILKGVVKEPASKRIALVRSALRGDHNESYVVAGGVRDESEAAVRCTDQKSADVACHDSDPAVRALRVRGGVDALRHKQLLYQVVARRPAAFRASILDILLSLNDVPRLRADAGLPLDDDGDVVGAACALGDAVYAALRERFDAFPPSDTAVAHARRMCAAHDRAKRDMARSSAAPSWWGFFAAMLKAFAIAGLAVFLVVAFFTPVRVAARHEDSL